MNTATDNLTIGDRAQLMARIRTAIQDAEPEMGDESMQQSVASLARLEPQLIELVRITQRTSADSIEPYLAQMMEDICSTCPAQQHSGFCPVRQEGGCILFRNPRLVVGIIDRFLAERAACAQVNAQTCQSFTPARKEHAMLTRILVAVDESAPAAAAVKMGVELASKLGAKLALIHVTQPPAPIMMTDVAVLDIEPPEARLESARTLLKKIRRKLPAAMSVEEIAADGHPADKIVTAARDWNADLIILGTHGRHGLSRYLLGSTAEAVMRRAGCPVLIAREKSAYPGERAEHQQEPTAAPV